MQDLDFIIYNPCDAGRFLMKCNMIMEFGLTKSVDQLLLILVYTKNIRIIP